MKDKVVLETIAKAAGYEQSWIKHHTHGTDVLLWTKNNKGNYFEWDPINSNGDIFELCVIFGINFHHDKQTKTVSVSFVNPLGNPSNCPDVIAKYCEDGDVFGIVRTLVLRAAYTLAKIKLKQESEKEELVC